MKLDYWREIRFGREKLGVLRSDVVCIYIRVGVGGLGVGVG